MYKTIDLCAGIGGIRRGFELTDCFQNVLSAEIDSYAAKTYKHLFGEDPTNDVTSEEFKERVAHTHYDVLLAGFPCQSFSSAGKQLGFRDTTRGTIFFELADIISRTNPRAIFLENVANLVSHDRGNTIKTIIRTLENELEYRVIGVTLDSEGNFQYDRSSLVRNSKDFGVPQNRPRTYIMAFSKKIYGKAVKALNDSLPVVGTKCIYETVEDILENEVDDHYYLGVGYLETLKRHKAKQKGKGYGFGYSVVNQEPGEKHIAHTILATGGSGRERNLVFQPKEGIAGKVLKSKKTPINSEGIRVMTPAEWGRLQGFIGYGFMKDGKDTFSFPEGIPETMKYKLFGNSVTIPTIETMARFMLKCFEVLQNKQEQLILSLAIEEPYFIKRHAMEYLGIHDLSQTDKILNEMIAQGEIVRYRFNDSWAYKLPLGSKNVETGDMKNLVLKLASKQYTITTSDIRQTLSVSANLANALLSELVKSGDLVRVQRGLYSRPVRMERLFGTDSEG